jgi:hypothetical protein
MVAERFDDGEHLFESDEAAAVEQLVLVDGSGQLGGVGRKIVMRIAELPTLADGHLFDRGWIASLDERDRRNNRGGIHGRIEDLRHSFGSFVDAPSSQWDDDPANQT